MGSAGPHGLKAAHNPEVADSDEWQVTVETERDGRRFTALEQLTPQTLARKIAELGEARDLTLTLVPHGSERRLLVGVDNGRAILGLELPGALYQFVRWDAPAGTEAFPVAGQTAEIEARFVLDLDSAATVAGEWLRAGDVSQLGFWERR